jgi:L-threonylcarbamoyladenylate synthase
MIRILAPTPEAIAEAAQLIQSGGLVAFPTETVYGLGANARSGQAVQKIFTTKGRPSSNPIIVHVASIDQAKTLTDFWPERATHLAEKHWPGPLTLVLERATSIPKIVTASGPTVGLRIPNHPVALALIRAAGLPLAAPSANRSEQLSPTTAQHVADSLGPFVDDLLILDGGACSVGIESTVLDLTTDPPKVLRPGMLAFPEWASQPEETSSGPARSPGKMLRHYAPKKPLRIVRADDNKFSPQPREAILFLDDNVEVAAAQLYAELRRLDADPNVLGIIVIEPPNGYQWDALHDRLNRAAH